jgi:hypothetical protein
MCIVGVLYKFFIFGDSWIGRVDFPNEHCIPVYLTAEEFCVSAATATSGVNASDGTARRVPTSGGSAAGGFTAVRQLFSGDAATGKLESSGGSSWPNHASVDDSVACSGVPKRATKNRAGPWCGTSCAGAGPNFAAATTSSAASTTSSAAATTSSAAATTSSAAATTTSSAAATTTSSAAAGT